MTPQELEMLLKVWEAEAKRTIKVLEALPKDQYDFRPDAGGRSIGELAWHLAEGEAYHSMMVAQGGFNTDMRPPGLERPRQVEALAPGYDRIYREAIARIRPMNPAHLERRIRYFSGDEMTGSEILWSGIFQNIHHRGQLSLMCRLAGGVSPSIYGPNREDTAAMRAKAKAAAV
jgi:uncharacterized damage-inducible protein DinB